MWEISSKEEEGEKNFWQINICRPRGKVEQLMEWRDSDIPTAGLWDCFTLGTGSCLECKAKNHRWEECFTTNF